MGIAEPGGDLRRDAHGIRDRKLRFPLQPRAQRFALDVRHDIEDRAVDGARVEQREDVRVLQLGSCLDLSQEPLDPDELREFAMHDFDRNFAVVTDVVRQVHVRHSTRANLHLDGVAVRQGRLQTLERFHLRDG